MSVLRLIFLFKEDLKMVKKIAASVLALTMIFGSGALTMARVMPDTAITASAEEVYGDFKYTYDKKSDSITITGYTGNDSNVTIPSQIEGGKYNGKKVKTIGMTEFRGAFQDNKKITSVTIPSGVTNTGPFAFSGCTNLKTVKLPYGVTVIDVDSFRDCSSLTSINIPSSVTTIHHSAFKDCTALKSVNIPVGVEIYGEAFYNCPSLTSIVIPSDAIISDEVPFGFIDYDYSYGTGVMVNDFKFYCYEGTKGEEYCKRGRFDFEYIEPENYPGNVNGDKDIDVVDLTMLINHVNGEKTLTSAQKNRADVNNDGNIDISDVVAIANHINGVKNVY